MNCAPLKPWSFAAVLALLGCEPPSAPPPVPPIPACAGARTCAPDASASTPDSGAADAGFDAGAIHDAGLDAGRDAGIADAGHGPSLAISARGGHFETADGGTVDVRGAISCCGGGYGWPLFDEAWASLVAANKGTFLHARLGPFRTEGNGETDWAQPGGGYVEANGKADLAHFNEPFWARVRALLSYARDRRLYVEVDVIDGWGIKHCRAGNIPGYSAWEAAFNAQGLDLCATAGSAAIATGSEHERWVRKVVAETGRFDNVLYQDGNEAGLIPGYSPEWTRSMQAVIRDEERRRGYGVHPFGTNSGNTQAMQLAEVDYLEFHQNNPVAPAQCFGKPCLVNEYNPTPPLTAAQFRQRFCDARAEGTTFWYWRHDQTDGQLLDSLAFLGGDCN